MVLLKGGTSLENAVGRLPSRVIKMKACMLECDSRLLNALVECGIQCANCIDSRPGLKLYMYVSCGPDVEHLVDKAVHSSGNAKVTVL